MPVVDSRNGVPIRLPDDRWHHITSRHPEMETEQRRVLQTVAEPDCVAAGDYGTFMAVWHYSRTPLTSKHLVVAYREVGSTDGFVVTAYLTTRPSPARIILWKR